MCQSGKFIWPLAEEADLNSSKQLKNHLRDFILKGITYRVHRFSNICTKSRDCQQTLKASVPDLARPPVDADSGTEDLLPLTPVVADS